MANRTKSFFEHDHGNKPRSGQWHNGQRRAPLSETTTNTAPQKPPIPANTQTKSKLKAFQFVNGQPEEPGQDETLTEHDATSESLRRHDFDEVDLADVDPPADITAPNAGDNNTKLKPDTPQLPHAHTFPCTPGTRLPLEDLIGNFDDSARNAAPAPPSPEEHIGWIPNSSSNLLTPSRKRKRARSSSPSCPNTSSQRQSAFFAATGQAEKTTPEADPAADLWKRYATGRQGEDAARLPELDQLMFQASPKKLETPAKSAGLRRWASTGNDWPTSRTKRRRTQARTGIDFVQDQQDVDSAGKSKVAAMVEKLQESLASQKLANPQPNPAMRVEGPSSSSPLPAVGGAITGEANLSASPLQTKNQSTQAHIGNLPAFAQVNTTAPPMHDGMPSDNLCLNSDSGRGDESPPAIAAVPTISAPLKLQGKAPLPAYKRPTVGRTTSGGRQYPQRAPPPINPPPIVGPGIDEFGDDLDLSAADLEELMTQQTPLHQRPLHQIPAHPNPPAQQQMDSDQHINPIVVHGHRVGNVNQLIPVDEFNDNDDEFGFDDIDEAALEQAEVQATQAIRISPRKRSPRKVNSSIKSRSQAASSNLSRAVSPTQFQRYIIKQVVDGEYTNQKGRSCPEKVVVAEDERTSQTVAITLRDSWTVTPIGREDVVHVTTVRQDASNAPPSSPLGQIMISDAEDSPFLIIHPDHMLSATSVADSFDCIRKAVLKERIKATGEASKAMVYGNILHEIFQQALLANQWDENFLAETVERTVENHVEGLWELGMRDTVLAIEEIKAKMGELASWARIFVADSPSEVATVEGRQGDKVWLSISKLIAIEEHIWSPRYGLKGNIDATVQATTIDIPNETSKQVLYPVEVKTGRTTQSAMHMAQTALYTLLLSDRYDVNVAAGVLYYLESSAMTRIAPPVIEMRQMVQQRNRLAAYLHRARYPVAGEMELAPQTQEIEESGLPGLLRNPFKCGKCYAQASCFSYHALAENGSSESAGMVDDGKKNHGALWAEAVGHLLLSAKDKTDADVLRQWFVKWDHLLTFEEGDLSRLRKELWTMDSAEREATGRCFGNLVIAKHVPLTASNLTSSVADGIATVGGKINRFVYVFIRSSGNSTQSFAEGSQLTVGEPVVVSSETGQWALANGYVTGVTRREITVAVDRKLGDARQRMPGFDNANNQRFKGIMTVGGGETAEQFISESPVLYRLDKDEFSNGLALVRNSLVALMSSHPIQTKLRNQLVFNSKPSFAVTTSTPALPLSQLGEMNEDQRATVGKVLSAQDYALILGMPGTGKTTTIAHIIRALLAEGQSILLTSFTHTAVDNILLKIRDIAPPGSILRLGVPAKINAQVQEFCQLAATPRKTIMEVDEAYMGCRIVATTCMGTNHAIFNRRAFDVCIVDEASQITLPVSLGPLLHARKFVLVGDHYQLPPLVQNKAALEGGLDVSLFRQLSEAHPEAVATLGKQYRMCEDIMTLANVLIYNGQLRCGTEAVAQRQLQNLDLSALSAFHGSSNTCSTPSQGGKCWLKESCKPERKVVFANMDAFGKASFETLTSGKNITNQLEATLAAQLVLSLLAIGVPPKNIGVITLYRSQLALMRRLFKTAGISREVDIDSADRFQGRDKECIIVSMVRSNVSGIVGDLLKDWRRVNVALTRAKSKLIVLGSRQTLRNNDLLAKFLRLVDEKGWSMDMPKGADGCHSLDFSSQTTSGIPVQSTPSPAKSRGPGKSPSKRTPQLSQGRGAAKILQESMSAGNRSPGRFSAKKAPGKVISGRGGNGTKKQLQEAAIEIFEDLTGEDL